MRQLPAREPAEPDSRSATRYLVWVWQEQWRSQLLGMLWGMVWMLSLALMPAMIGRAIDRGLLQRSTSGLVTWAAAVMGLALLTALAGAMRHRSAITNWLSAAYITIQVTSRHSVRVGADLPRLIASGDVLAIGTTDVEALGICLNISARFAGSVVSAVLVAIIMLTTSVPLGLVVLVGVPVMMACTVLLLRPLRHRQDSYRELQGELSDQTVDIAQGIRVLRGIGGEDAFSARYAAGSQRLRKLGIGVGRIESLLAAQEVLLPGLLTGLVTWLAAYFALHGQLTLGQLVAFYGYASFLVLPLSVFGEAADAMTRAHVAAERVVRLLRLSSPIKEPESPRTPPPAGAELTDTASGLTVPPGALLAVACAEPEDADRLANRLARYVDDGSPTLGGVPLSELPVRTVRERILLAGNGDRIFAGTLRSSLSGATPVPDDVALAALHAASADDIVDALDAGLDAEVEEKGRNFSGGQLQRLRLARALIADPEVLLAVEATSAVDAHTEARIAERIGVYRAHSARRAGREGTRTTVLFTTSPLVLDHADTVAYVENAHVVAVGSHADLLAAQPAYGALVTRGEDDVNDDHDHHHHQSDSHNVHGSQNSQDSPTADDSNEQRGSAPVTDADDRTGGAPAKDADGRGEDESRDAAATAGANKHDASASRDDAEALNVDRQGENGTRDGTEASDVNEHDASESRDAAEAVDVDRHGENGSQDDADAADVNEHDASESRDGGDVADANKHDASESRNAAEAADVNEHDVSEIRDGAEASDANRHSASESRDAAEALDVDRRGEAGSRDAADVADVDRRGEDGSRDGAVAADEVAIAVGAFDGDADGCDADERRIDAAADVDERRVAESRGVL
jgi:ABC-type multidrug transport system fused ATPase/permease subunit